MADVKNRGQLDFMGTEEKEKEALTTELEKTKVEEEKEEHHDILEKLHRADDTSSSSSSSSEEEGKDCENKEEKEKKKKKKKSIKEKIKEKMECKNTAEVETVQVADIATTTTPDEKKGLLDKIKDKIPGHSPKKPSEEVATVSSPATSTHVPVEGEREGEDSKEKKGFLGKIMDKIPGYHKNTTEGGEEKQGGASATH